MKYFLASLFVLGLANAHNHSSDESCSSVEVIKVDTTKEKLTNVFGQNIHSHNLRFSFVNPNYVPNAPAAPIVGTLAPTPSATTAPTSTGTPSPVPSSNLAFDPTAPRIVEAPKADTPALANNKEAAAALCRNGVWNGSACFCHPGFYRVGQECGKCPAHTVYDGVSACVAVQPSPWDSLVHRPLTVAPIWVPSTHTNTAVTPTTVPPIPTKPWIAPCATGPCQHAIKPVVPTLPPCTPCPVASQCGPCQPQVTPAPAPPKCVNPPLRPNYCKNRGLPE